MHILCRKYFVTQQVLNLLEQGGEQVVNLGAGFDHVGAYLSQKGIQVYELDRSSMIGEKSTFIRKEAMDNSHLHFVSCDVEHARISEVLSNYPIFDSNKKTVFIAEGFFDYLEVNTMKQVIADVKILNPDNTLVSTFFSLNELNVFYRWIFKAGVSVVGETLKSTLTRNEYVQLLEKLGMKIETEITASDMESKFVKQLGLELPVMKGFYIFQSV